MYFFSNSNIITIIINFIISLRIVLLVNKIYYHLISKSNFSFIDIRSFNLINLSLCFYFEFPVILNFFFYFV